MSGGIQMAPRNEAFAAKLALTYAELYDGISPVRQRVSLRIAEGVLELKNAETHAVTRWSLAKMREVADQSDETSMTFAADNYDPARLVVREVEALRALIKTGAEFKPLSGPRGQMIRLAIVGVFSFGGIFALLIRVDPLVCRSRGRADPRWMRKSPWGSRFSKMSIPVREPLNAPARRGLRRWPRWRHA